MKKRNKTYILVNLEFIFFFFFCRWIDLKIQHNKTKTFATAPETEFTPKLATRVTKTQFTSFDLKMHLKDTLPHRDRCSDIRDKLHNK